MSEPDLIEIRIPMIVTADGKWAASGSDSATQDPDWDWLDEMCGYEKPTRNPQRYWITAYVKAPKTLEVAGSAVKEATE